MSDAPAKMELALGLSEDREHVIIQMNMNGEPRGHILLDAPTAQGHAIAIGHARSQLNDPVAATLDPGSRIEGIGNPAWTLDLTEHGPTLALRHPGLGWLGFVLPPHEAKHMGEVLLELARTSEAGPGAG